MNKIVTAAEANRNFSALLKQVKAGETVTITSHGEVVARIVPERERVSEERIKSREAHIERLRKQPALNAGRWTRDELYDD